LLTLGANIDRVVTIPLVRNTVEPDSVSAEVLAELTVANGITVYLRESRHIQARKAGDER
jgi:pyridoxine 5'-phosphate synthase PdxJ